VATRPNPTIDIGPVDFSCAFCVCDTTQPDLPIVYCSEGFETLTGYSEEEIIGQNCRFLQYPGGRVSPKRPYQDVNSKTLQDLRRNISKRRETQHSIINYRKDGTCFQNLVTMIPIAWDSPDIKYYVGFQADAGSLGC
jgi:PAS domain S-box-containing protein